MNEETPEQIAAALEAEADGQYMAAIERAKTELPPVPSYCQPLGPGGALPVSDLSQRLKMLADAWVEIYEDGPLRIKFDIEGRRAHVQQTQGTPGRDTPVW